MGGRGRSQPTATGFTWYEYHAVYKYRDIHFLSMNDAASPVSPPVMSQTSTVTYVTFDKDGKTLRHISVYKDRIKLYDVDLTMKHKDIGIPHVHECDPKTGYRLSSKIKGSVHDPTKEQYEKINFVNRIFKKHKKEILGI